MKKDKINFSIIKQKGVNILYVNWSYGYKEEYKNKGKIYKRYKPLRYSTGININIHNYDPTTQRIVKGNDRIKLNAEINRIEQDVLIIYTTFYLKWEFA